MAEERGSGKMAQGKGVSGRGEVVVSDRREGKW